MGVKINTVDEEKPVKLEINNVSLMSECPNCLNTLHGQYCSQCGQNQRGSNRYFWTLVNEAFEGLFSWNSKAWKTTLYLFFRPGLLTNEHFANRRARYISPFRLYIITSVAFFLLLSLMTFLSSKMTVKLDQPLNSEMINSIDEEELSMGMIEMPPPSLNIPFVSNQTRLWSNKLFRKKLEAATELAKERPKIVIGKFIDSSPIIVLLVLPIFALILKSFYLKSGKFYTQHLVFAVHTHCFLFAMMMIITVITNLDNNNAKAWQIVPFLGWIGLYMPLSLQRVYQQSWPLTLLKSALLFFIYLILFIVALAAIMLLGITLL